MKKKILFLSSVFIFAAFVYDGINNMAHTNGSGAPAGHTGSPGDGNMTCAECHGGSSPFKAGWITSNVGSSGYYSDSTYTLTFTATEAGRNKFGFEASPQSTSGTLMGTITLTNTTETKFTGGGSKYVTHTQNGTTGASSSKTWTFNWKPPAKGAGAVTVYAAFNATNANNNSSGDLIYTSTLVINEAAANSIHDLIAEKYLPVILSHPSTRTISLAFHSPHAEKFTAAIYSTSGQLVYKEEFQSTQGDNIRPVCTAELPAGIYLVSLLSSGKTRGFTKFAKL